MSRELLPTRPPRKKYNGADAILYIIPFTVPVKLLFTPYFVKRLLNDVLPLFAGNFHPLGQILPLASPLLPPVPFVAANHV